MRESAVCWEDTEVSGSEEEGKLVSWCFEPSQPQRITSGLEDEGENRGRGRGGGKKKKE